MQLPLTGGCQCGTLRYEVTEAPRLVYLCHCTDCQKMTSSAFSMGVVIAESAFRLTKGEPKLAPRKTDSGRIANRVLCPDCGCWISSAPRPGATVRTIRGGTLDDTSWLKPTAHLWTHSKQPWVAIPAGDRIFETQPADLSGFFASGGSGEHSG